MNEIDLPLGCSHRPVSSEFILVPNSVLIYIRMVTDLFSSMSMMQFNQIIFLHALKILTT